MEKVEWFNLEFKMVRVIDGLVSKEVKEKLINIHNSTLDETKFKVDVRLIDMKTGDAWVKVDILRTSFSCQTSGGFIVDRFIRTKEK